MKTFKTKPSEKSRPVESHVLIHCSENADSENNILHLNTESKTAIYLKSGWNLLTVIEFPDLKYGFRPAYFAHNPLNELNPNCQSILEIDLSHFDANEVKTTENMFSDMGKLHTVDLSNVKFNNVENMDRMFGRCFQLENVIQNKYNTFVSKSLKSARGMFIFCDNLKKLSLPYFVSVGVKNVEDIFSGMKSLEILDLSGWNLKGVKICSESGMVSMFNDCQSLNYIYAVGCDEKTRSILKKHCSIAEFRTPNLIFAINIYKRD